MLNNTKDLLQENKNAFRVLHNLYGYDFKKDYKCIKHTGKFTINCLVKNYGLNLSDDKIVLLFKKDKSSYLTKDLYLIELTESDININIKVCSSGFYSANISTFYAKYDFNDERKKAGCYVYIISQNKELLTAVNISRWCDRENHLIDYNNRYILKEKNICYNPNLNLHYYNRLTLVDPVTLKKYKYVPETKTDNINLIIDKTGYIVEHKKQALKYAANALRSKRLKNEFLNVDYSKELTEVNTIKQRLQNKLINDILNSDFTGDYLFELSSYNGLINKIRSIIRDIELFNDRIINKKYNSVIDAKTAYNNIIVKNSEV